MHHNEEQPEKKKKLKSKPWLTQGLLKSIKLKNKMYKQFFMHPSNYQFDKYKKYRNVLNQGSSTFFMKSPLFKKCWSESPPIKTITVLSFESFPEIYLRSF